MIRTAVISFIFLLTGCAAPSADDKAGSSEKAWTPPAAGIVVAADSMKVEEDELNNAYFSVEMRVSEGNTGRHTDGFRYDLHATYGKAVADGLIIMPFRGERLKPVLRRGEGYTYFMGFIPGPEHGGDTSFHEYYRIDGDKEYIRITPLKGFKIDG